MSYQQVADASGVSVSTLSRWEDATVRPYDGDALIRVAAVVDVALSELFDVCDWPPVCGPARGGLRSELALFLERVRVEREMSRPQMASVLGVVTETYGAWERGSAAPSADNMVFVSRGLTRLGVSVSVEQLDAMRAPTHAQVLRRQRATKGHPAVAAEFTGRRPGSACGALILSARAQQLIPASWLATHGVPQVSEYEDGKTVPLAVWPLLVWLLGLDDTAVMGAIIADDFGGHVTPWAVFTAARRMRGYSNAALADKLGVHRNTVYMWGHRQVCCYRECLPVVADTLQVDEHLLSIQSAA